MEHMGREKSSISDARFLASFSDSIKGNVEENAVTSMGIGKS